MLCLNWLLPALLARLLLLVSNSQPGTLLSLFQTLWPFHQSQPAPSPVHRQLINLIRSSNVNNQFLLVVRERTTAHKRGTRNFPSPECLVESEFYFPQPLLTRTSNYHQNNHHPKGEEERGSTSHVLHACSITCRSHRQSQKLVFPIARPTDGAKVSSCPPQCTREIRPSSTTRDFDD